MLCLDRNKQTFYYALYTGKTPVVDSNGNRTGEFTKTYSSPVAYKANISEARGAVVNEMFGLDTDYTKTIVTNLDCPIDEFSILWIGVSTTSAHNYVVTKKAKSLNSITYAIKEVDVSA